ncbi:MAG: MATE family efflux transporter [Oscillospiraceae bacterium]|nr:MATE family efflux transporter [Oscillospiraceae bacterium]
MAQQSEKELINDLTTGSTGRKLLFMALPLMASNLLQIVYHLVDMAVIGNVVGSVGQSAVSVSTDIITLSTTLCMGFSYAGQVLVAQRIGRGDREALTKTIGNFLLIILCGALLVTALGLCFSPWLLRLMNTPAEALADALAYTRTCFCGMLFVFGYNAISGVLRGMGETKLPMLFIAIASVTNVVLDLLFVAALGMGTFGAALATVIGQLLAFAACVIFALKNAERLHFSFRLSSFRPDYASACAIIKLGVPMSLQSAAVSMSKMFVNSFIYDYGVIAAAVTGMGDQIGQSAYIVTEAIKSSTASAVGQNFGAGKLDRISRTVGTAFVINIAFAVLLSAVMVALQKPIYMLFNSEEAFLEMALTFTPMVVLRFIGYALRSPFLGLINGLGRSGMSLIIGLLDAVVARVAISLLLGVTLDMGIVGFWYGSVLSGFVPVIIGAVFWLTGAWKRSKPA